MKMGKMGGRKRVRLTGLAKYNSSLFCFFVSNDRLIDANNAGTRKSKQCTLILTEGDSAKVGQTAYTTTIAN